MQLLPHSMPVAAVISGLKDNYGKKRVVFVPWQNRLPLEEKKPKGENKKILELGVRLSTFQLPPNIHWKILHRHCPLQLYLNLSTVGKCWGLLSSWWRQSCCACALEWHETGLLVLPLGSSSFLCKAAVKRMQCDAIGTVMKKVVDGLWYNEEAALKGTLKRNTK